MENRIIRSVDIGNVKQELKKVGVVISWRIRKRMYMCLCTCEVYCGTVKE